MQRLLGPSVGYVEVVVHSVSMIKERMGIGECRGCGDFRSFATMESMPTKQLKPAHARTKRAANSIAVIRPTALAWQQPWLISGFSTRKGGLSTVFGGKDLNLGIARVDSPKIVEKNRTLFFREVLGPRKGSLKLVTLKQIHSGIIHVIKRGPADALSGDGFLTQTP